MSRALAFLAVASLAVSCTSRKGSVGAEELFAEPSQLNFGRVFVGHPKSLTFSIHSASRVGAEVKVLAPPGLTVTPATATVEAGGMAEFQVQWAPSSEAPLKAIVFVSSATQTLGVSTEGEAAVPPACSPSSGCMSSTFNPGTGRCEEAQLADGTECSANNACFEGGSCFHGACLGNSVGCDDHNLCTTDACDAQSGCVHLPKSCPAPGDPCQAAVCDPVLGCQSAPVADGTACGPNNCVTAQVCLAGVCKTVTPPDGSQCSAGSPCKGAGLCVNQTCIEQSTTPLKEVFTRDIGGVPNSNAALHPVLDALGSHYWVDVLATGAPRCALTSVNRDGLFRFSTPLLPCVEGAQLLVVGNRVVVASDGTLFVLSLSGVLEATVTLNGPPITGGTRLSVLQLLADGNGQLVVVTRQDPLQPLDPSFTSSLVVLKFDPATRAQTQSRELAVTGFTRAVMDSQDNLYLGALSPKLILSLNSALVERWRVSVAGPTPIAVTWEGLMVADGTFRSTLTGAVQLTSIGGTDTAIMGSNLRGQLISTPTPGGPHLPTLGLFRNNAASPYVSTVLGASEASQLALADGELIISAATETAPLLQTGAAESGRAAIALSHQWHLQAVDTKGVVRWSCLIPQTVDGTNGEYEFRLSAVSLADGRWTVQQNSVCYTCKQPPPTRLRSFELGSLKAAAHGWVSANGNGAGNARPLP